MLNSYQYSGSFEDLLKLLVQRAQQDEIDKQIAVILKQFFDSSFR